MTMWQSGDRVFSPAWGNGVILSQPWFMPVHHLVQFDRGVTYGLLKEILELDKPAEEPVPICKSRRKKAA
uniref:Uncharacterized protein n=1 Tax=Cyanothece sp. (strain PCC 7425 / ATCC 29141) TaxID=395961 RepID=B8HN14_CYAP4